MCQALSCLAAQADNDPTLDAIVEKLRMLRAEIDATLVDLIIYNSRYGALFTEDDARPTHDIRRVRSVARPSTPILRARLMHVRLATRVSAARFALRAALERISRTLRRQDRARLALSSNELPPRRRIPMRQAGSAIATMLALSLTAAMVLGERVAARGETAGFAAAAVSAAPMMELSGRFVQEPLRPL
jgi:hypothetical protein